MSCRCLIDVVVFAFFSSFFLYFFSVFVCECNFIGSSYKCVSPKTETEWKLTPRMGSLPLAACDIISEVGKKQLLES